MASNTNTTLSIHFILLILLSFSTQPHARQPKFFTNIIHYLSNSAPAPAPAPGQVSVAGPILAPGLAPVLAPEPVEEEYGYGLWGKGSSESSSEESIPVNSNETPVADELTSKETPFEKLASTESYSGEKNGYSGNSGYGYSSSVNENNGYNQNMYSSNNGNGYSSSLNKNNYNNEDGYSSSMDQNNGYRTQNGYNNEYSSAMNQNNGYNTESYMQNDNNHENGYMSYENEKNGYNGNGYTSLKDENSNKGYMMEQQGMSDTRFLENGKYYSYEPNNNGNGHETSYEEEVSDNGEGYYRNNDFDPMEEDSERQSGVVKGHQGEYVP